MKSLNLKIGDKVSLIDQDIKGKIIKINGNLITLLTSFDLELSYEKEKIIKIEEDPYIQSLYQTYNFLSPKAKSIEKKTKIHSQKKSILEVDLHAEKLFKDSYNLPNHEIISKQLETAEKALNLINSKDYKKVILIHGNGKRILREKIHFLIEEKYSNLEYFDASYQKYGTGATEVRLRIFK